VARCGSAGRRKRGAGLIKGRAVRGAICLVSRTLDGYAARRSGSWLRALFALAQDTSPQAQRAEAEQAWEA
jgi:hypothetical protein